MPFGKSSATMYFFNSIKPVLSRKRGLKPNDMLDDDWESIDELARSTIMLSISDVLLFNVENEHIAWDMWRRLKICMLNKVQQARFIDSRSSWILG